jgi:hypothetical protein
MTEPVSFAMIPYAKPRKNVESMNFHLSQITFFPSKPFGRLWKRQALCLQAKGMALQEQG